MRGAKKFYFTFPPGRLWRSSITLATSVFHRMCICNIVQVQYANSPPHHLVEHLNNFHLRVLSAMRLAQVSSKTRSVVATVSHHKTSTRPHVEMYSFFSKTLILRTQAAVSSLRFLNPMIHSPLLVVAVTLPCGNNVTNTYHDDVFHDVHLLERTSFFVALSQIACVLRSA